MLTRAFELLYHFSNPLPEAYRGRREAATIESQEAGAVTLPPWGTAAAGGLIGFLAGAAAGAAVVVDAGAGAAGAGAGAAV